MLPRVPGYFFSDESGSGGRRRQGPADRGAGGEAARRLREERGAPDVPGCSKQPPRVPPVGRRRRRRRSRNRLEIGSARPGC
ncbi:hypothetical protein BDA96_09G130300 [Sorghum bicolor]|jgi:hypothetical protein|uniref:Uncharacterized protein n=1 Tax=Sorghum bicolor TaxID=4558 RepID=A0A921U4F3_SORBI|nr:hypothetical protein BDA96_09G130300 [Sorghum bicolor]